jgi:hypothetical protein
MICFTSIQCNRINTCLEIKYSKPWYLEDICKQLASYYYENFGLEWSFKYPSKSNMVSSKLWYSKQSVLYDISQTPPWKNIMPFFNIMILSQNLFYFQTPPKSAKDSSMSIIARYHHQIIWWWFGYFVHSFSGLWDYALPKLILVVMHIERQTHIKYS